MDFSPINVTMLGVGGVLLLAAKDNRSPVNVVKAALGLEPEIKLSTPPGGDTAKSGADQVGDAAKKIVGKVPVVIKDPVGTAKSTAKAGADIVVNDMANGLKGGLALKPHVPGIIERGVEGTIDRLMPGDWQFNIPGTPTSPYTNHRYNGSPGN